ncbi:MAG: NAD(P)/FAD-dependent oxidoreductase [Sphingobacteriales bacterium]|nr:NAD(P)/FAD-dependent oxidoreductase [Sphingobacteriales bacterium]
MSGISVQQVQVWLKNAVVSSSAKTKPHPQEGALLFTHKGVSGPAVLRLSAWEARTLHALQYRGVLCINFLPALSAEATLQHLQHYKQQYAKKQITASSPFEALALRLWQRLCAYTDIDERVAGANLPKQHLHRLVGLLRQMELDISGQKYF